MSEYDGLTLEEAGLARLMSDVSEDCYAAGWMSDCEYDIWRLVTEGGAWGMCSADDLPQLAIIRVHAERIDRWIRWNKDGGPDDGYYLAVPLGEWRPDYANEIERRRIAAEERAARQAACAHGAGVGLLDRCRACGATLASR